jgi:hypothetical protein
VVDDEVVGEVNGLEFPEGLESFDQFDFVVTEVEDAEVLQVLKALHLGDGVVVQGE